MLRRAALLVLGQQQNFQATGHHAGCLHAGAGCLQVKHVYTVLAMPHAAPGACFACFKHLPSSASGTGSVIPEGLLGSDKGS